MAQLIVLIGDLEGSKKLGPSRREKVQAQLKQVLQTINRSGEGLVSPHTITLGDEFQAVYSRADRLLQHMWQIMALLHPVMVRFAAGIGTITTPVNREQAIGMDGPAFHAARDGIDRLKQSESLYHITLAEAPWHPAAINLANESLHLLSREMRDWKKTRFVILSLLEQGIPIKEIAGTLGISETAVYKNREEGSLDIILQMKASIVSILNEQL